MQVFYRKSLQVQFIYGLVAQQEFPGRKTRDPGLLVAEHPLGEVAFRVLSSEFRAYGTGDRKPETGNSKVRGAEGARDAPAIEFFLKTPYF